MSATTKFKSQFATKAWNQNMPADEPFLPPPSQRPRGKQFSRGAAPVPHWDEEKLRYEYGTLVYTEDFMLGDVHVAFPYPIAQRRYSEGRAKRIAAKWSDSKFQIGVVVRGRTARGETIEHLADGQHGTGAARIKYGDDAIKPYFVIDASHFDEDTFREFCAQVFLDRNPSERQAVQALDRYAAYVTACDDRHVAINAIVVRNGFEISPDIGNGKIRAINVIEAIAHDKRLGLNVLDLALGTIAKVWDGDQNAFQRYILKGLALFHANHPDADKKRCHDRTRIVYLNPRDLVATAQSRCGNKSTDMPRMVYALVVDAYNWKLSDSKKLKINPNA